MTGPNYQKYCIAAVIPCYRVEREIQTVLQAVPKYIKYVIVVDDASPDAATADYLEALRRRSLLNPS